MSWQSEVLIPGEALGSVLRFSAPISFWGGVCPQTARVVMSGHPQFGKVVSDKILVIPELAGSSSSSAIILELIYNRLAPKALVLGESDAILPVGVIAARQMGWLSLPVVVLPNAPFRFGDRLHLAASGVIQLTDCEG